MAHKKQHSPSLLEKALNKGIGVAFGLIGLYLVLGTVATLLNVPMPSTAWASGGNVMNGLLNGLGNQEKKKTVAQTKLHKNLPPPKGCPGQYSALVSPCANFAGIDQGIDFTPASFKGFKILAPAAGTITQADSSGHYFNRTDGQAQIIEKLDRLPNVPYSSRYIYFAEIIHLSNKIRVNTHVKKGDVIGYNWRSPGIEVGWAWDASHGFMCTLTGYATSCGLSFNSWIKKVSARGSPR